MSLTVGETVGDISEIIPCSQRLHDFRQTRLKPAPYSAETPLFACGVKIAWPL